MTQNTDSPVATAVALGKHSSEDHQTKYDAAGDRTPVQTVLEALEEASGQSAKEMSVRLYDAIDPDALNDLFQPTHSGSERNQGRISFSVGEFAVTVRATGCVRVRPLD